MEKSRSSRAETSKMVSKYSKGLSQISDMDIIEEEENMMAPNAYVVNDPKPIILKI